MTQNSQGRNKTKNSIAVDTVLGLHITVSKTMVENPVIITVYIYLYIIHCNIYYVRDQSKFGK